MAKFGWAYVDCSGLGGSGSEGPANSLQFVTESGGATTGSAYLTYYTASTYSYKPHTMVLSGTLLITGAISASTYHIDDIAIIDATGSTYFGDDQTDLHVRTGSMELYKNSNSLVYKLDAVNTRLGVGTAPSAPVHIYVAATTSVIPAEVLRLETNDEGVDMNVGYGPGIDFFVGETGGSDYGGTVAVIREQASDANTDCAMVFHTTTDDQVKAGDREKMRITSAGNVGIGTIGPTHKLTVAGAISGSSALHAVGAATFGNHVSMTGSLTIGADSDGTDRTVTFGHSTLKTIMGIDDSADAFVINTDASFDATLGRNSLTIDASHNMTLAGDISSSGGVYFADAIEGSSTLGITGSVSGAAGSFAALNGTSLALQSGGITAAGSIAGATSIDGTGDLTMGTITMTGFSVDADGDTALKSLAVDNGSTIGCDADTDLLTLSNGNLQIKGVVSGSSGVHFVGAATFGNTLSTTGSLTVNSSTSLDGAVTINDTGADVDFRVETADESHMIFVEGSSNRMSIGDNTGSPGATLEVKNHASAGAFGVPLVQLNSNDTDQVALDINASNIDANVVDILANAVTTAKVINISADGLTTGNALRVDDNSSDTGSRKSALIIQNHASAIAATALHVQSDGGITGIALDKNFTGGADATVTGLQIDLDKTGTTTSNNTIYGIDVDIDNTAGTNGTNTMVGIRATPTLTHAADAGTPTVKGAVITATGGTNGTAVATGMELTSTGADTNNGLIINCADGGTDLKILSSADTGDYFSIATTAVGATTITTVDDGGAAADLTFTVDGDIILGPAGGDVLPDGDNTRNLGSGAKRWANVYTGDLHLKNDRGDWTIVEEEDFLCVINNKTGKKYKMGLIPMEDDE